MSFMDYNSRALSSYGSDQAVGQVSNLCRLFDIGLQHHSLGGCGDLENDSVRNSRISHANGLTRKKEVGSFTPETFSDRRNQMFNERINIGDQQLVDTASKVCNLNSEMLLPQFQNLIQLGILDAQSVFRASGLLDSSHNWRKVAAQGSLLSNQAVACDGNSMVCNMGVKQIASEEVIHSPEQISSITVCSDGDLRSDGEPFETGSTFSKGLLNSLDPGRPSESNPFCPFPFYSSFPECGNLQYSNACNSERVPEVNPEKSNFLSSSLVNESNSSDDDLLQCQLDMLRHKLLSQQPNQMTFDKLPEAQSWDLTSGNECDTSTLGGITLELPQLSLEQPYEIEEQQSCPVQHVETANIVDSNIMSEHDVLLQYANYKSLPQNAGSRQDTFLMDLHLRICNGKKCKCDQYRSLISHYDTCHFSACRVCRPFRKLSSTNTVQIKFGKSQTDLLRALHRSECNVQRFSIDEDIQPPPKRTRIEDVYVPENEPSTFVDMLEDQSLRNEESSRSEKSSESLLCNGQNIKEINRVHLNNIENPIKTWLTTNHNSPDYTQRLNFGNGLVLSEEFIYEHTSGMMNNASSCKNRSVGINRSQGLDSGTVPDLHEQPNCIHEKEESHFISMPGQAECEGEGDSMEIAVDDQSRNTSEKIKLAVSLTDCFTAEQIKEHICSLNPSLGQRIMRGARESTVDIPVGENTCQLCSMDKLLLSPPPIYCSYCNISIKRNLIYYWTFDQMRNKFYFCTRCLKASHGNSISFQGHSFSKSEMKKEKNNEESEESWVQCDKCENWQHQICALYNAKKDPDGQEKYVCPICRLQDMEVGEHVALPAAFGAKDLPRTPLSNHIEQRLFKQLKIEREERAKKLGKGFDKVPEVTDLVVRVVSSVDKLLKVKEQFLNIFHDEGYPSEFPYKSKAILLFQKIDGVDVCLFIMYAQEFGPECGQPNQRCIYISYLDSVKYFRPEVDTVTGEALRTFVYQEILIGYLDYCKKRGFATCYIWACPPQKGEDYIFYCHPETQKTPKKEKLVQWYKSMLRKGTNEDIVLDVTNLYDNFFIPNEDCSSKITAARLPYFDGDYWPSKAEEMILKMEIESGGESEINVKKLLRRRTLKAMGHKDLTVDAAKDILLMQKLGQSILPSKEDFIIIHLLFTCMRCHEVISGSHWSCKQCKHLHLCSRCFGVEQNLSRRKTHTSASGEEHIISEVLVNGLPAHTAETESIIENYIFESRPSFLSFCQRNHYQFGTLRRAKHSSMMILYHLHKQVPLTTGRTCSICLEDIMELAGWHCEICPEFDVCTTCYYKDGESCHNHKLIQLSPKSECGVLKYQARQRKIFQLQVLLDVLVHSSNCNQTKSNPCSYPRCAWLKNVFHHCAECNVRATRGCEKCKKIWWILRSHSRACKDPSCRVPRCLDIREKAEMLSQQSGIYRRNAVKE